jgi:DNA (cytosine-5)-methyltransferase 1
VNLPPAIRDRRDDGLASTSGREAQQDGTEKPLEREDILDSSGSLGPYDVPDEEFFPRRKSFTPEHNAWRKRVLRYITAHPELFPRVRADDAVPVLRDRLDEEASRLQAIARILSVLHGDPRWGNPTDPVDDLVYILLSRATPIRTARTAFEALKREYADWDALLEAHPSRVARVIRSGGLEAKKVRAIRHALLALRQEFGSITLEPARDWTDERLFEFLTGLEEIGPKSAYCVMMYTMNRRVFPADTHVQRVLTRLGLHRESGLDLTDTHRKRRQVILGDLIPPILRYALHVNLIAHGQTVCRSKKPKCGECALNRFCTTYREAQVREAARSDCPTVVDLFCGAGGLSEGFHRAGFRTVLAVDQNPVAIRTYRLNHPEVPDDRVLCEDLRDFNADAQRLRDMLGDQEVDVLVGGPPCQGFSRAGWRSRGSGRRFEPGEDDRNHLYSELISLLRFVRPKVVLMENVPGIGEVRFPDGSTFQQVTEQAMRELGYAPTTWTLNAAHHGVPQMRFRRVIIGTRLDTKPISEPAPQYCAPSNQFRYAVLDQANLLEPLEPPITLMEAIGDLPALGVDDGQWTGRHTTPSGAPRSRYLERFDPRHPQGLQFSHVSRFQNDTDIERYGNLEPGETYMDLIRKRPDLENYRTDAFDDKYYRLPADAPSRTIVAHLRKDGNSFVHPTQVRSLSVREAARLQSFNDEYIFTGSRGDQFEQIGNAVPPLMSRAMAQVIIDHLYSQERGPVKQKGNERSRFAR